MSERITLLKSLVDKLDEWAEEQHKHVESMSKSLDSISDKLGHLSQHQTADMKQSNTGPQAAMLSSIAAEKHQWDSDMSKINDVANLIGSKPSQNEAANMTQGVPPSSQKVEREREVERAPDPPVNSAAVENVAPPAHSKVEREEEKDNSPAPSQAQQQQAASPPKAEQPHAKVEREVELEQPAPTAGKNNISPMIQKLMDQYSEAAKGSPQKEVKSASEAAQEFGIKEGTVKERAKALQEAMKNQGQNQAANAVPDAPPVAPAAPADPKVQESASMEAPMDAKGLRGNKEFQEFLVSNAGKGDYSNDNAGKFSFPTGDDKTKANFSFDISEKGVSTSALPSDPAEKQKAMDLMCEGSLKAMKDTTKDFTIEGKPPENQQQMCESMAKQMDKMQNEGKDMSNYKINGQDYKSFLKPEQSQGAEKAQDHAASVAPAPKMGMGSGGGS